MYFIIQLQKDKSLAEIMYVLNVNGIKKFRRLEKIVKMGIRSIMIVLIILRLLIFHFMMPNMKMGSKSVNMQSMGMIDVMVV